MNTEEYYPVFQEKVKIGKNIKASIKS